MFFGFDSSKRNWTIAAVLLFTAFSAPAMAGAYVQTNLVSNIPGIAAITDPLLVNPWGFSHSGTSPFWTSNQGTNTATLYNVTGPNGTTVAKAGIASVAIPTTAAGPQGPTGQVFSGAALATNFLVGNGGNGARASFIFADLNGTISAWNSGATAFVQATVPGAVFTGLTINQNSTQLFAASAATGVQVFNSSFTPISLGAGAFATPPAIAALNLVTFNVKDINGLVYVTYAPAGLAAQRAATAGQGAIAIFTEAGVLVNTLIGSELASPWGLTLSPANFGPLSNALLVGNFSFLESEINAFDPTTFAFLGSIAIDTGANTPGGLWEIGFGTGGNNGSPNTLYFTDGINGETAGLFGAITVPEPFTLSLFGCGLGGLMLMRRRRRMTGS